MADKTARTIEPVIPKRLPYSFTFREAFSVSDYLWGWRAPEISVARWRLFELIGGRWLTVMGITEDHIDYLAEHFDLVGFGFPLDMYGRWNEFRLLPPSGWHRLRTRMDSIRKLPCTGWSPKSDYGNEHYEAHSVC